METIHRAASAVSETIFGEHGEHGTHHGQTTTTGERTHEPLSGRTGDTTRGEPYDAGNLDEVSQKRIADSRDDAKTATITTTTSGDSRTAGGYISGSDISPRSGPSAGPGPAPGTVPIPASTSARQGGSYSSARETAARAMSAAETPGSGHDEGIVTGGATGATAGGGLWSSRAERDESGYKVDDTEARRAEDGRGQHTKFADEKGDVDAADVSGSRVPVGEKKVKHASETDAGARAGVVGVGAGATSFSEDVGGPSGASTEGEPMGRRKSLTAHLPGGPGGEGLRRTSDAGTGEKYVKSTGLKADGGDFDASAPGAGKEADRLLHEQGVSRTGHLDKSATGQTDTNAPTSNNTGAGEKLGDLKDKIKMKLHKS